MKSIQDNQKKQDDKLDSLNDQINELYENEYDDYDYLDLKPRAKTASSDDYNKDVQGKSKVSEQSVEKSRFTTTCTMSNRFKQKELTGENIDETLAENITDLFRNGMNEINFIKDIEDCFKIIIANRIYFERGSSRSRGRFGRRGRGRYGRGRENGEP
ncbi:uncharacterized protein LOC127706573 [Mytilus californianus]|uniref:uncharacterized protein LOC127706573 n=1 Tax=Mytilus californianus TaxID=6549 RepID=UPI002245B515|nr:uncharacterized protein LOC127706573 [Mytilus californianus]